MDPPMPAWGSLKKNIHSGLYHRAAHPEFPGVGLRHLHIFYKLLRPKNCWPLLFQYPKQVTLGSPPFNENGECYFKCCRTKRGISS